MSLTLRGSAATLTSAIDNFQLQYHRDYAATRALARAYLATPPTTATANALAVSLIATLNSWGAKKRGAPSCQAVVAVAAALNSASLHADLKKLADSPSYLCLHANKRALLNNAPFASVADFDQCLIGTLHQLSSGVLIGNTNVTYPMKALLVMTGLLPAFDSQVRAGMAAAGLTGVNKTQYRLSAVGSADAKKICALPFYIADCASRQGGLIQVSVLSSTQNSLVGDFGRVFDILLFTQSASCHSSAWLTIHSSGKNLNWYDI